MFNVTEYNFLNVFRKVLAFEKLERERSKDNSVEFIVQVLKSVFSYWKNQKSKPNVNELRVELPNRAGEFIPAKNLYLGIEYDSGFLTEKLLRSNDELFLASPKTLSFFDNEKDIFFEWLGVGKKIGISRRKINNVPREYIQELSRSIVYPYISEIHRLPLKSSEEFLAQVTYNIELETDYCSELKSILSNAKPEHILAWLITDGNLNAKVSSQFDFESSFQFSIPYKQYKDSIERKYILSFIRFEISNTAWLPTNQDKLEKPADCVLLESSNFAANFLPIPAIDYTDEIFSTYGISKERIDQVLRDIGGKNNFSSLSQSQIYKLLLELPTFDPEGKYARQVYRMALVDLDVRKINTNEDSYRRFIDDGKVFGKQNSQYAYFPVSETYYLDNAIFCKGVSEKLCLAEIDRRRGRQKVKDLFGISPVENVKFRISSTPISHFLNDQFKKDVESFKVFFYTDRISSDHDEIELRALKNITLELCSDIRAQYSLIPASWQQLDLDDYEYINIDSENRQTVYIKVANSEIGSLQDLKEEVIFCESIVNILSNTIRLVGNEEFKYMYSVSEKNRLVLLSTKFNGDLSDFERAKEAFGNASNSIFNFWSPIANYFQFDISPSHEHELLKRNLSSTLEAEYFDKFYASINYGMVNSSKNFLLLKELFGKLNISLQDYNSRSKAEINIVPILKTELVRYHHEIEDLFILGLYHSFETKTSEEQEQFFEFVETFHGLVDKVELLNDFNFDYKSSYKDLIVTDFGIDIDKVNGQEKISDLFKKSVEDLSNTFQDLIPEDFINDPSNRVLILFKRYGEVWDRLKTYSARKTNIQTSNQAKTEIFSQLESEINSGNFIEGTSMMGIGQKIGSQASKKQGSQHRSSRPHVSDSRKSEIGLKGEFLVYKYLEKVVWAKDVKWVSKNSELYTSLLGDDSLGYDIRYIDSDGRMKFVEVKSTTTDSLEFVITDNEYKTAMEKRNDYIIVLVTKVEDKNIRRYYFLKNMFGSSEDFDFFNNPRFEVDSAAYRVILNGEEKYFLDSNT